MNEPEGNAVLITPDRLGTEGAYADLVAAKTQDDILRALARHLWAEDHDGAECPQESLPAPGFEFLMGTFDGSDVTETEVVDVEWAHDLWMTNP